MTGSAKHSSFSMYDIDEYKEKNDTLSGLVSKYQSFAEEN
jgi:hypothetical protein